jgi:type II secretory pathway pseudopilin PulG
MLVVISIIAILAALTIPAVMAAMRSARVTAISTDLNQLESACTSYKSSLGEYPPDFAGVSSTNAAVQQAAQNLVMQHLAKAFPRYQPGYSNNFAHTGWLGFLDDLAADPVNGNGNTHFTGWGINVGNYQYCLTPASALVFWLGGQPDWRRDNNGNPILPGNSAYSPTSPVRGFLGFAADPLHPFLSQFANTGSGAIGCSARLPVSFPFDPNRLSAFDTRQSNVNGFYYWPQQADGSKRAPAAATPCCPIVYFRAENGNYTVDGLPPSINSNGSAPANTNIKSQFGLVWPAFDTRLSNLTTPSITWMNPSSVQILSSGLDLKYGANKAAAGPLQFPAGGNYDPQTFDDVANFSGGTMESARP